MQCEVEMSCVRLALWWIFAVAVVAGPVVVLHAQTAADTRVSLLARAQVWAPTNVARMNVRVGPAGSGAFAPGADVRCEFVDKTLEGNSPKFACALSSGDEIKVKFGDANGEVQGEVVATRLLWALGFGADSMYPVRVICRGCPETIGIATARPGERLVEPAVVERKISGRELVSGDQPGWSWLELDLIDEEAGGASRAERDALKLLAVFIQHTDSKPEQQRLVCLDDEGDAPSDTGCDRPFMMINDLGLTFGRANLANRNLIGSVNLQEWSQTPVWKEDGTCVGNLPKSLTGTLKDPMISEEGRTFLAERLQQLSNAQIRALFEVARVELRAPTPGLNGRRVPSEATASADEWARVFQAKRKEITDRRCNVLWPGGISALFGTAPIHWLQDRSSHALTVMMNGISLFGYTRVLMAIATVLAFTYSLRAGAALLLLLALNGVLTDGAKSIVSSPRPDAVDSAVKDLDVVSALGDRFRSDSAAPSVDAEDGYGFPSGHVAVTTAFLFGLGYFFRWQWVWPLMAFWIPAMALSRLYLGRSVLGDVLGGVGVGVISATLGFLALTLGRLLHPTRAKEAAARALLLAGGCAVAALTVAIGAYDTGRFLGLTAGVMLLVHVYDRSSHGASARGRAVDRARLRVRIGRVALAALVFTAVWWGTHALLASADLRHSLVGALLAGAIPAFALLPAPLYLEHVGSAIGTRVSAKRIPRSRAFHRLHKRRA